MTSGLRIRQIVFACESTERFSELTAILGLQTPFPDLGVAEFGLVNEVYALGDQFIEIVVPTTPEAPARRFLDRNGEGGYMAIFQVPDIQASRARLDAQKLRRVWDIDLDDISASHIHPADIGGAIVSIDEPRPASAWRWGGPDWDQRSAVGGVCGITLSAPDPVALGKTWATALGADYDDARNCFDTEDGPVCFQHGETTGITAYHLDLPDKASILKRASEQGCEIDARGFEFCGVQMLL